MDRLDIEYDFLPRESEILRLHFWDAAFSKLKESAKSWPVGYAPSSRLAKPLFTPSPSIR